MTIVFATRAPERLAYENEAIGRAVVNICLPRDNAPDPAARAAEAARVLRDHFQSAHITRIIRAAEAEEAKAS
jgi:hypothetical protein